MKLTCYGSVRQAVNQTKTNLRSAWPWPWFIPYPTGHIGPHSDAICVCQELTPLLPPRWTPSFEDHTTWMTLYSLECADVSLRIYSLSPPSFVELCWLRPSSSLLVDLVLSCILVPASTVLAVVCACSPYGRHVQASEVVFLSVCYPWFVVQFWLWPPH